MARSFSSSSAVRGLFEYLASISTKKMQVRGVATLLEWPPSDQRQPFVKGRVEGGSPIYYPASRLPQWLQQIQAVQPIRYMADLVRGSLTGMPPGSLLRAFVNRSLDGRCSFGGVCGCRRQRSIAKGHGACGDLIGSRGVKGGRLLGQSSGEWPSRFGRPVRH
jgi:hypothetical protein